MPSIAKGLAEIWSEGSEIAAWARSAPPVPASPATASAAASAAILARRSKTEFDALSVAAMIAASSNRN
ncbi:hypothetical protein OMP38_11160 [Cohnella ginsengisoli]|uniref:Uncharacterized protein n=1 Tax=Cohnella ginsengisoli TaxID=425004 RepID=A0A9X4QML4_9BACL|nr:hypothetical protein [Cohnella ginsengisoli]MDG0791362.1 hypothetical protein [Cohnella ginsengisoli]